MSEQDLIEEGAENVESTEEKKAPVEPQRLCKGTMPSPLVWYIKFHESPDNKSAIAKKYFTTPGKISDIQSDSNQKYIVANMKWSKEELDAARATIRENFIRGQEAEMAAPGSVSKRGLATTQAGDEQASLDAIDAIEGMDVAEDAVSLTEARSSYNDANPRANRKPAEDAATSEEVVTEEITDEELDDMSEEDLDDLLG